MKEFREFIYEQHNIECNQKYDEFPYSHHLDSVETIGNIYMHLIPDDLIEQEYVHHHRNASLRDVVRYGLISHDSIEDARLTYNDIFTVAHKYLKNRKAAGMVADIVYCVTDEKGKNRKERKNDKYYRELKANKLAIFVKLCDIAANTTFSKTSGSSMYKKYKSEFPSLKEKLYLEEYKELFNHIENI